MLVVIFQGGGEGGGGVINIQDIVAKTFKSSHLTKRKIIKWIVKCQKMY